MKIPFVKGMIALAQNLKTLEMKEIAYLGGSPTGDFYKLHNITDNKTEWIRKEDFNTTYDFLEVLGY